MQMPAVAFHLISHFLRQFIKLKSDRFFDFRVLCAPSAVKNDQNYANKETYDSNAHEEHIVQDEIQKIENHADRHQPEADITEKIAYVLEIFRCGIVIQLITS